MKIRHSALSAANRKARSRAVINRMTPDWMRKPNAFSWAVASAFAMPLVAPHAVHGQVLPVNPSVAAGAATFAVSGKQLTVTNTPGTAINWQSFNIGAGNTVQFAQQNAASMVFNRVTGGTPSSILGNLISNGKVFLINPNGITIGAGARIDTAAFVASSLGISDANLLAGRLLFDQPGTGAVNNYGTIVTQSGGYVYFVGKDVNNSGVIHTPKGEIILAAGNTVEIINPKSPDLRVEITANGNEAVNLGKLVASGGTVGMFAGNIRQGGIASANTAEVNAQGKIVFRAKQNVTLEAGSRTEASGPTAGTVTVQAETGTATVSGTIEAIGTTTPRIEQNLPQSQVGTTFAKANTITVTPDVNGSGTSALLGRVTITAAPKPATDLAAVAESLINSAPTAAGAGGAVQILGQAVVLDGAGTVDASGATGGGTILVGGDYQGKNQDVPNSQYTVVTKDVVLKADALLTGNGGKVIVWADKATHFTGSISARGGASGGNGGFAEVSGKEYLYFRARSVDMRAPNGKGGTLLLDPTNIVINDGTNDGDDVDVSATSFAGGPSGATGTVVTADTTPTTIYESELEGIAGTTNIVLQASNNITLNSLTTDGVLDLKQTAGFSVTFVAGNAFTMSNTANTISTRGGSLNITGGSMTLGNIVTNGGSAAAGGAVNLTASGAGGISVVGINTSGTASGGTINILGQNAITLNGAVNAGNSTVQIHANRDHAGSDSLTMAVGSSITTTSTATGGTPAVQLLANNGSGSGTGTGDIIVRGIDVGAGGEIQINSRFGAATDAEVHGNILSGGSGVLNAGAGGLVSLITGAGVAGDPAGNAISTTTSKLSVGAVKFNVNNSTALTDLTTAVPINGSAIAATDRVITATNLTYSLSSSASAHNLTALSVSSGSLNADFGSYFGGINILDSAVSLGSGNFTVSANGAIARGAGAAAAVTTTGQANFITTTGDIGGLGSPLLVNVGSLNAKISGTGSVYVNHTGTGTLALADYQSGGFSTASGSINISAGGALAIGVNTNSGSSALNLSSAGAITQTAGITNTGTTSVAAGSANNITLNHTANNFGTLSVGSGKDTTIVDSSAIVLGASTVSGNYNVAAGGDITTSAPLALNGTANILAAVGVGSDLFVTQAITHANAAASSLDLRAYRHVLINTGGSITSNTGALNVTLNSDRNNNGGAIGMVSGTSISSNGGSVSLVGGSAGTGFATGLSGLNGVKLDGAQITTGGGNVVIKGKGDTAGTADGVQLKFNTANASINAGAGSIDISGVGGSTSGTGIRLLGQGTVGGASLSASGGINISGAAPLGGNGAGVLLDDGAQILSTGAGGVTINASGVALVGIESTTSTAANLIGGGSNTGAVTLVSDSMNLANVSVNANSGALTVKTLAAGRNIELGASAADTSALGLTAAELANLSGTGGLTIGSLTGTTGSVSVTGNGNISNITGGAIAINTSAGGISFKDGSTLTVGRNVTVETADGSIDFGTSGTGALNAGTNTALIKTANGAIDVAGVGTNNVTAGTINLSAKTGIGATNALLTAADTVTFANVTSGAVQITNTKASGLTVSGSNGGAGNVVLRETAGNISIGTTTSGGNLNLTSNSTSGKITQSGGLTVTGNLVVDVSANTTAGNGDVSIDSSGGAGTVTLAAGSLIAGNLVLSTGTRNIDLGSTVDVGGSHTLTTSGTVTNISNLRSGQGATSTASVLNASGADGGNVDLFSQAPLSVTGGVVQGNLTINLVSTTYAVGNAQTGTNVVNLNTSTNSIGGSISVKTADPTIGAATTKNFNLIQSGLLDFNGKTITINAGSTFGNVTLNSFVNTGVATFALNSTNATTLKTSGNLTVSGTVRSGGSLTTNSAQLSLGATTVNGNLGITSTAAVSQTGTLVVTGTTTIGAGAGSVTLNDSSNNFQGAVSVTTSSTAALRDTNAIALGASSVGSTLDVTAGGTVTQTAAITATGQTTINAAGQVVTLTDNNNDFSSISVPTAASASISDKNAITVVGATTTGAFNVSAVGAITQTNGISAGSIDLTGSSYTSATGGLTSAGAMVIDVAGTSNTGGAITGGGSLEKKGAGTLTLGGINTYTGNTTVTAGTLQAGSASAFGTGSNVSLANAATAMLDINGKVISIGSLAGGGTNGGNVGLAGGTLTVGNSTDTQYDGVISGGGSLIKTGTSVLTLGGLNTYTATTTINQGALKAAATNVFSGSSAVTVGASGSLNLNNFNQSVGSIAGAAGGTVALGSGTLTSGGNNTSTSLAGTVSGSGGLTKVGSGTLTLSGANGYTGTTTVNGGILQAGNASAFGTASNVILADATGVTLDLNDNSVTIGSLSGGGATGGNVTLGTGTLTTNTAATTQFDGVISGTGGLNKTGTGVLTLGRANTYTGATAVNQGALKAAAAGVFSIGSATSVGATGTLDLNGFDQTVGSIAGAGAVTLGTGNLTSGGDGTSTTLSGTVSGNGGLIKTGAGALTLSGNNTYDGTTAINAGSVLAGSMTALGSTTGTTTVASGAVLDVNGQSIGAEGVSLTGGKLANNNVTAASLAGDIALGAGGGLVGGSNQLTLSGVISGTTALTKQDGGTTILTGTNTYTGGTTISAGTLQIGAGSTTGSIAGDVTNNAALTFNRSDALTYNGIVSGSGVLNKTGTGALTLGGNNTYTGATNINQGSVVMTSATALGATGGNTVIGSGATLDLNGLTVGAEAVAINGGTLTNSNTGTDASLSGAITLGSGTNTFSAADAARSMTLSGAIGGGANTVTIGGLGKVIYTGTNTYTGATTINANATLQTAVAGLAGAVVDNGSLIIDETGTVNFASNVSGSGTLTKTNTGVVTLTGTNSYSGSTTINGGKLVIDSDARLGTAPGTATAGHLTLTGGTLRTTAGFTLNANRGIALGTGGGTIETDAATTLTYNGIIAGGNALTKTGTGTLVLGGANTYTGATNINAGTLAVTANDALGTTAGTTTVANGATLDFRGVTYSSTEGVTLNGGTALTNTTGTSSFAGAVSMTTGSTVDVTTGTQLTLSGVVSESAASALTKTGAGTLVLSAANTYTGGTNINGGTISVGNDNNLGTGGLSFNTGTLLATAGITSSKTVSLAGAGTIDTNGQAVTLSGVVSGTGPLNKTGTGALTLGGNNSYSGVTNINQGSVVMTSATALGATGGNTVIGSGATLDLNGQTVGAEDVTVNGGTLTNSNTGTDASLSGAITLGAGTNTFSVANAARNMTLSGAIGGGANTVTIGGLGKVIYTGTNTYTGATTINANATLQTAVAGLAGAVVDNGSLIIDETGTVNFASNVSGSGTLTKTNTGVVTLTGTNSYSGSTTINGGKLVIDSDARLGTAPGTATAGHLTLTGGTLRTTAGFTLNANRGIALGTGGGTIETDAATTLTYNGIIAGGNALTKTGTGTLVLGGANTYTGATNINAGTLAVTANDALGTTAGTTTVANGATLDFRGVTYSSTEGVTLNGGTALTNTTGTSSFAGAVSMTTGSTVDVTTGTQLTLSGVVSESAASALTKTSAGTLVLSAANTYTGGTNINGGTISVGNDNNLGTGGLSFNTGTLLATAGITSSKTVSLAGAGTIDTNGQAVTLNGVVSGTGPLNKTGTGALTLGGNNSYSGVTNINQGSVVMTSATALGATGGNTVIGSGATLDLNGLTVGAEAVAINGGTLTNSNTGTDASLSGAITLGSGTNTFSVADAARSMTLSGAIGGGANTVTIGGLGKVIYTGTNTYTGATTINANSTLQTAVAGLAGAVVDNGSLILDETGTVNFASNVSGSGTLTKTNTGVVTLTGTNSYSGSTTINGGKLVIDSDARLGTAPGTPTAGHLTLAGGTLRTTATFQLSTNRGIALGTGGGTIETDPATTLTYSGIIAGGNALTKTGTGTLVLGGTNTYTGATNINAGTLAVTVNDALGTTAGTTTVANGAALDFRGVTYSSTEGVTLNGGTALTNTTGTSSFAGAVSMATGSTVDVTTGTQLTLSGVVSESAASALTKTGAGTLALSAANTYTGGANINGGVVVAGTNTSFGTGTVTFNGGNYQSAAAVVIANNVVLTAAANVDTNNFATTLSGVVSGGGALNKTGLGALTLGGNNTYTGVTNLNQGSITATNSNSLGSAAATNVAAGTTLLFDSTGGTPISNTEAISLTSGAGGAAIINATGTAGTTLGGAITLAGGGTTASQINALGTGSKLLVSGAIDATTAGAEKLSIGTGGGTGSIVTVTNVGTTQRIGALTVTGAGTFGLGGGAINTSGADVTWSALTGTVVLSGNQSINTSAAAAGNLAGGSVAINADLAANSRTLTVNTSGGTTSGSVTLGPIGGSQTLGTVTVTGGAIALSNVTTSGAQAYTGSTTLNGNYVTAAGTFDVTGATTLGGATVIDTTNGGSAAGGANVTFNGVGSTINGANTLNVTGGTGGTIDFQGAVGGTGSLTSVTANAGTIKAVNVKTSGAQAYTGATTLNGNYVTAAGTFDVTGATTLGGATVIDTTNGGLSAGGANVTFNGVGSTINGANTLNVTGGTGGTIDFQGAVGGTGSLTSVTANAGTVKAVNVKTSGAQAYTSATTLNGNYVTAAGTFNVTGATTLSGATLIDTTNGGGSAGGANVTFNGVGSTINGANTLNVTGGTGGTIDFQGAVGGTGPLTSVTANAGTIKAVNVKTSGAQAYTGATTLNGNYVTAAGTFNVTGATTLGGATLIDTTNGGSAAGGANVTFNGAGSTINGANTLNVTGGTGGTIDFQGAVGGIGPLTSVTANAGTVKAVNVKTSGAQAYTGATTLNGNYVTAAGTFNVTGATTLGGTTLIDTTNGGGSAGGANVTFNGAGSTIDQNAGSGLTIRAGTGGAVAAAGVIGGINELSILNVTGGQINLNAVKTKANGGTQVNITGQGAGTVTIAGIEAKGGNNQSGGSVNIISAANVSITGEIKTTGGGAATTAGNVNITSTTGSVNLSQIDTTDTVNGNLTVSGATGIGQSTSGSVKTGIASLTSGASGDISLTSGGNNFATLVLGGGRAVTLRDTDAVNVSATTALGGALNLSAGGAMEVKTNLTANGGIALSATQLNLTGTQFVSSGGAMTFTGPVVLTGATTFDTTGGSATPAGANVTFATASSTVNGAFALTLNAGSTGNIDFQGAIGNTQNPTALNVTGNTVKIASGSVGGAITIAVDDLDLLSTLDSGGAAVNITTATASRAITLGGTGGLSLSNTELGNINTGAGGAGLLTIGGTTHTGTITVAGAVNMAGANNSQNLAVTNQGTVAIDNALQIRSGGTITITSNAGGSTGIISDSGSGSLRADNIVLSAQGGIGASGSPLHIGQTATINAINSGTGDIYLQFTTGNATVGTGNALTNNAAGGAVNLKVNNGTLTTGTVAVTSTNGAVALISSDSGAGAGITIGTGGITSKGGTIGVYSADNLTVNGIVDSATGAAAGNNITLVAGVAGAGATGFSSQASESSFDTVGALQLNNRVIAGNSAATGGGNVTLMSTGAINQITGSAGGIQAGTDKSLTALSFNDAAAAGVIDLRNVQAGTGNAVGNITLEARNGTTASPPYASSNIFYSAINGVTVNGLGTAANVSLGALNFVIGATSNLQGTNVILNATGTGGAGTITVNSTLGNANVNNGTSGGSLTLNAFDGITLNGAIGTSTTPFDHALNLVAGAGINVNNSIYMSGARNLSFKANSSLATLNSSGGNVFTGAPSGGGVVFTAPATGMAIQANNIDIGTSTNRVQNFIFNGGAVSAAGGAKLDVTLKATGTLNIYTSTGTPSSALGNLGTFAGTALGDILVAAGTANGVGSSAGIGIQAGTLNVNGGGNFVFRAGTGQNGGTANAIVLVGTATVDVNGNLVIKGGNTTTGGGSAFARFDPLVVKTGQSNVLLGGTGANTSAQLVNAGQINLFVNQTPGFPATFTSVETGTVASGLILAGASTETGTFNFNAILSQRELIAPNVIPPGALVAPITLTGGVVTTVTLAGRSAAFVESNVVINPTADLSQQIRATNDDTKITDLNKNKNKGDDDGC